MTAPMLKVEQLSLRLGRFPVLIDVDFSVGAGSCTGVVGPNGAGKTTLLDCISAHRRPGSGRILIDGAPVHRLRPAAVVALGVARTFQNVEQFKLLTVKQLALIGRHQRYRTSTVSAALALPRSSWPTCESRILPTSRCAACPTRCARWRTWPEPSPPGLG
jgi:branched-chain amino acid transport system ATP-binding protein